MKKILFAVSLAMSVMFSVAGCGSGSGGSGTSSVEGSGTIADNTATGSITLAWDAPTNSDGTPVVNVAGYNVYYGTSSGVYDKNVSTGTQTTCTINGLMPGTYYLAVTCYDSSGHESGYSNEASKTVL
ncbi:MAG: hypothetical protein EHM79_07130 [Geobacter sp.]|nr:MAG: hypothetical protein EHM79_07130 [Geobacter sp.]